MANRKRRDTTPARSVSLDELEDQFLSKLKADQRRKIRVDEIEAIRGLHRDRFFRNVSYTCLVAGIALIFLTALFPDRSDQVKPLLEWLLTALSGYMLGRGYGAGGGTAT
jgi:hypothetical protein